MRLLRPERSAALLMHPLAKVHTLGRAHQRKGQQHRMVVLTRQAGRAELRDMITTDVTCDLVDNLDASSNSMNGRDAAWPERQAQATEVRAPSTASRCGSSIADAIVPRRMLWAPTATWQRIPQGAVWRPVLASVSDVAVLLSTCDPNAARRLASG